MVSDGCYVLDKEKKGNAEVVKWKNKRGYSLTLEVSFKKGDDYVTAIKTGKNWSAKDGHIQNCKSCHGNRGPKPGSVAVSTNAPAYPGAYQKICTQCHQKLGAGPQAWNEYFDQD